MILTRLEKESKDSDASDAHFDFLFELLSEFSELLRKKKNIGSSTHLVVHIEQTYFHIATRAHCNKSQTLNA